MTRAQERPPAGHQGAQKTTGGYVTTSIDDARRLVENADCAPGECCLMAYALGYTQGWDTAVAAEVDRRLLELAESIALHDWRRWVPIGRLSRQRRIAREVAEMAKRAVEVKDSPGWPPVRRPGGGSDAA